MSDGGSNFLDKLLVDPWPALEPLEASVRWWYAPFAPDAAKYGWPGLRAEYELERWGQPSGLLALRRNGHRPDRERWYVYAATRPSPVLSNIDGLSGLLLLTSTSRDDWRPVPGMVGADERNQDTEARAAELRAQAAADQFGEFTAEDAEHLLNNSADAAGVAELVVVTDWVIGQLGEPSAAPEPDREPLSYEVPGARTPGPHYRPPQARLLLEHNTYADLAADRTAPERMAGWFAQLRAELADPLVEANFGAGVLSPMRPHADGLPYGLAVNLATITPRGTDAYKELDAATLNRDARRLARGQLHILSLDLYPMRGSGRFSEQRGDAHLAVWTPHHYLPVMTTGPTQVLVDISWPMVTAVGEQAVTDAVLRVARAWVEAFGAASGYVSVTDYAGASGPFSTSYSPWELEHVGSGHRAGDPREVTRGIHWGTLLGPGHLSRLDDAVPARLAEAGATVDWWPSPDGEVSWVQLGPTVSDPSPPEEACADLLRPVLPVRPTAAAPA